MGERKGQQKYYPPDWRPEHGSLDNYYGTHPLRDRARKLDRGILIIRFEMPYNIWCDGCNNHIGMGVRYNAEKTKVGMYYSTPIYKFTMKCVYCPTHIEMQTDPKNCDYNVIAGARRQNNRWKAQDAEQIEAVEYNEKQRLRNDAMFNLDYGQKDKQKAQRNIPSLAEIYHLQQSNWKDCYQANCNLRRKFRQEKKQIEAAENADNKLISKLNLNFNLVAESTGDKIEARQTLIKKMCDEALPHIQNRSKMKSRQITERSLGVKLSSKAVRLKAIKKCVNVSTRKKASLCIQEKFVIGKKCTSKLVKIVSKDAEKLTTENCRETKSLLDRCDDIITIGSCSTEKNISSVSTSSSREQNNCSANDVITSAVNANSGAQEVLTRRISSAPPQEAPSFSSLSSLAGCYSCASDSYSEDDCEDTGGKMSLANSLVMQPQPGVAHSQ